MRLVYYKGTILLSLLILAYLQLVNVPDDTSESRVFDALDAIAQASRNNIMSISHRKLVKHQLNKACMTSLHKSECKYYIFY